TAMQLGNLTRRFSEKTLIKASFLIYALALLIIPFVHTIWLFLIPAVIFGIAQGMNLPSIQTLLIQLADVEYRAAIMSLNGMVLRLGQTLGPLVMSAIFLVGGFEATFFFSAGLV
ncbi:MAG: MFS transporter, partial [Methanophagales archaeon]|nr:MFS transporter [Methanophagales archaeon]